MNQFIIMQTDKSSKEKKTKETDVRIIDKEKEDELPISPGQINSKEKSLPEEENDEINPQKQKSFILDHCFHENKEESNSNTQKRYIVVVFHTSSNNYNGFEYYDNEDKSDHYMHYYDYDNMTLDSDLQFKFQQCSEPYQQITVCYIKCPKNQND